MSKVKGIILIILSAVAGGTIGGGWMLYLCKTGPQQLFIDSLHNQTTEAIVGLTLLKGKKYDDLNALFEARIAMSGTSERIFKHPSTSSTEKLLRGYYELIAKETPPPAIVAILDGTPDVTSDPRPLAEAMVKGANNRLAQPLRAPIQ
ncbi:MAG: hypothetical protein WC657_05910 [Candidatus Paceibacterota bacterium]|jgi:hypothetical protein